MTKAQKKQMLEIIDRLQQAHEEIGKALQKKDSDMMQSQTVSRMLGECQETAVLVGESIEKTEGEKHITVSYLEEYCELLYMIHEEISGGNYNNKQICKSLQKQLIKIENSVKNDISVRKEVVFFPYKASMWDSLESVYLAARKDPDCDAYCVPIPYYDLKPDRSFGEMHYEGGVNADGIPVMYPKNIEVTDWQTYNFEERRPDEIYIHNGYDKWNFATSVHPRFYAKNLRKYTDKLVYIPYFVLDEIEPDNQDAIDGMKHFCFMPGTIYADRVIVQSEKMRQIYINEYIKAAKEAGLSGEHTDRRFLKRKFLGTGSPKIDKVLHTRKEDLEIPGEWLKIIEKPDGSWKKIVFYNTVVSALLHSNEKMLRKMESVFEIFKENQDEVALLWRPHPLIQATIESMRPRLWDGYQELRDRYIEEGWGIYDDSADLDRAVVVSDVYYGDWSSVVELCRKAGLPILIQDVDALSLSECIFPISNGVVYDGYLWFVGLNDNGIYCMDLETFQAELVYRIPWEDVSRKKAQYGRIVKYQEKILLVPWLATQIAIFDMRKKELKYVEYTIEKCGSGSCFYDGVLMDNKVFLAPSSSEKNVCVNMDAEKVECASESLVNKYNIPEGKRAFAFGGIAVDKKDILFTVISDDRIVKYDTELNDVSMVSLENLDDGGSGILGNDDGFWIIHKEKKEILYYDIQTAQIHILNDFPKNYVAKADWNFHQGIVFDSDLILLPRESDMCLRANAKDCNIEQIKIDKKISDDDNYWEKYMECPSAFTVKDELFITDYRGNCYILSKDRTIDTKKISVHCGKEDITRFESYDYEENNYYDNLSCFLQDISKQGGFAK